MTISVLIGHDTLGLGAKLGREVDQIDARSENASGTRGG
jgi:hypothetical protein